MNSADLEWLAQGEKLQREHQGWRYAVREWWQSGPINREALAQAADWAGPDPPVLNAEIVRLRKPGEARRGAMTRRVTMKGG